MHGATVLSLLLAAVLSHAYVDVGVCPDFKNFQSFEIPPYLGRWYENKRFPVIFETNSTCVTTDYGAIDNTTISITNAGNLPDGTMSSAVGTGTATGVPGQLAVEFGGVPSGHYNVLFTDYDDYSCVYSCAQVGEYREQFAWLLTRYETLNPFLELAANNVFSTNGIDISLFNETPQGGDCVYTDPPEL